MYSASHDIHHRDTRNREHCSKSLNVSDRRTVQHDHCDDIHGSNGPVEKKKKKRLVSYLSMRHGEYEKVLTSSRLVHPLIIPWRIPAGNHQRLKV